MQAASNGICFIYGDHLGFLSVFDSKCVSLVWSLNLMGHQSFHHMKENPTAASLGLFSICKEKFFCYDFGGYHTNALIYSSK